jgi:hypothetical protein
VAAADADVVGVVADAGDLSDGQAGDRLLGRLELGEVEDRYLDGVDAQAGGGEQAATGAGFRRLARIDRLAQDRRGLSRR